MPYAAKLVMYMPTISIVSTGMPPLYMYTCIHWNLQRTFAGRVTGKQVELLNSEQPGKKRKQPVLTVTISASLELVCNY